MTRPRDTLRIPGGNLPNHQHGHEQAGPAGQNTQQSAAMAAHQEEQ